MKKTALDETADLVRATLSVEGAMNFDETVASLQRLRGLQTFELLIPVTTPASPTNSFERPVQLKNVRFRRRNLASSSKNPGRGRRIYQRTAETN